jgi:glycosyltransferase involved in cell wall biosynthesis
MTALRVAWFGPEPRLEGGVSYVATQILRELPAAGVTVDAYVAGSDETLEWLRDVEGLRLIREPVRWNRERWSRRAAIASLASSQAARLLAQRRLVARLLAQAGDYDAVYQFSQLESPWSQRSLLRLPPVVVHPQVHAAGELRWLRNESGIARACETRAARAAAQAVLGARTLVQRRSARHLSALIAPSRRFGEEVARDYGIAVDRIHVVPNPIDLERFRSGRAAFDGTAPLELLYVSRLAVRKGLELVVELTHRLSDLAGSVRITIVGARSMFSDYTPLLARMNPAVGFYAGSLPADELAARYRIATAVLQPSHYEPFALTVGEALASGTIVIASDRVGAAEQVDRRVCRTFPRGDVQALEELVRRVLEEARTPAAGELRSVARAEAERLFAPAVVGAQLAQVISDVASTGRYVSEARA